MLYAKLLIFFFIHKKNNDDMSEKIIIFAFGLHYYMMRKKRIMILGANAGQAIAINEAHRLGYYVISADIHPDAPGHAVSDEQAYIDITDQDCVLAEARRRHIDGITPYWSDVLAPVTAYVAEQLSLPGNPASTVETMTQKQLFRQLLAKGGFPTPKAKGCRTVEEAVSFFSTVNAPAMLKPIDSSGSRGVFRVCSAADIRMHFDEALAHSTLGSVILEEFIETDLPQQDGDIFVIDGKVVLWGICEQHKDVRLAPYTPAALLLPSGIDHDTDAKAKRLIQDVITALDFRTGPCNVEYIVSRDGRIFILDIGPRNGGNMIPQVIRRATGHNVTAMTLQAAVGDDIAMNEEPHSTCAMSMVVHADHDGTLGGITLAQPLERRLSDCLYMRHEGDPVRQFHNSSDTIAFMTFSFDSREEMLSALDKNPVSVCVR